MAVKGSRWFTRESRHGSIPDSSDAHVQWKWCGLYQQAMYTPPFDRTMYCLVGQLPLAQEFHGWKKLKDTTNFQLSQIAVNSRTFCQVSMITFTQYSICFLVISFEITWLLSMYVCIILDLHLVFGRGQCQIILQVY